MKIKKFSTILVSAAVSLAVFSVSCVAQNKPAARILRPVEFPGAKVVQSKDGKQITIPNTVVINDPMKVASSAGRVAQIEAANKAREAEARIINSEIVQAAKEGLSKAKEKAEEISVRFAQSGKRVFFGVVEGGADVAKAGANIAGQFFMIGADAAGKSFMLTCNTMQPAQEATLLFPTYFADPQTVKQFGDSHLGAARHGCAACLCTFQRPKSDINKQVAATNDCYQTLANNKIDITIDEGVCHIPSSLKKKATKKFNQ